MYGKVQGTFLSPSSIARYILWNVLHNTATGRGTVLKGRPRSIQRMSALSVVDLLNLGITTAQAGYKLLLRPLRSFSSSTSLCSKNRMKTAILGARKRTHN